MNMRAVDASPFLHPCPIQKVTMPPRPIADQFDKLPRHLGIIAPVNAATFPKYRDKAVERLSHCLCLPSRIDQIVALAFG
jgi:hypothetical protein